VIIFAYGASDFHVTGNIINFPFVGNTKSSVLLALKNFVS